MFFQSKIFKRIIVGVGVVVVLVLVFAAGVFVGYGKARFSYQWGENYDRNFGGPHHGILGFFSGPMFLSAHGAAGSVLSINESSSSFVVSGDDNAEKTVLVSSSTAIRSGFDAVNLSDMKINDSVIVIGRPTNDGRIEARLVRILPPPPAK